MRYLVFVKFLPGGSLAPGEFFVRIKAQWHWIEVMPDDESAKTRPQSARSAICISDYDSIEQFSIDLSTMPGAGISNVEVVPVSEGTELVNTGSINPSFQGDEE